jgi:hypothetical protein
MPLVLSVTASAAYGFSRMEREVIYRLKKKYDVKLYSDEAALAA